MPVSQVQAAKRLFASVLFALGRSLELTLDITRDSPDAVLESAAKRVLKRASPGDAKRLRERRVPGLRRAMLARIQAAVRRLSQMGERTSAYEARP